MVVWITSLADLITSSSPGALHLCLLAFGCALLCRVLPLFRGRLAFGYALLCHAPKQVLLILRGEDSFEPGCGSVF